MIPLINMHITAPQVKTTADALKEASLQCNVPAIVNTQQLEHVHNSDDIIIKAYPSIYHLNLILIQQRYLSLFFWTTSLNKAPVWKAEFEPVDDTTPIAPPEAPLSGEVSRNRPFILEPDELELYKRALVNVHSFKVCSVPWYVKY